VTQVAVVSRVEPDRDHHRSALARRVDALCMLEAAVRARSAIVSRAAVLRPVQRRYAPDPNSGPRREAPRRRHGGCGSRPPPVLLGCVSFEVSIRSAMTHVSTLTARAMTGRGW
jgi:hypothetical protein